MYQGPPDDLKKQFESSPSRVSRLDLSPVIERLLKGKNIKQFAEETGIPRTEVYHILRGRKKYAGLEALRKLAHSLGMDLWELIALAEGRNSENIYLGEQEAEFTAQFKKEGVLISSDTPPNKDLFVGRLVFEPGAQFSGKLTHNCLIYLRPTTANIEVTISDQNRIVHVNHKILFNGRLPHQIKNPSRVSKSTCLFVTTPSFWSPRQVE